MDIDIKLLLGNEGINVIAPEPIIRVRRPLSTIAGSSRTCAITASFVILGTAGQSSRR